MQVRRASISAQWRYVYVRLKRQLICFAGNQHEEHFVLSLCLINFMYRHYYPTDSLIVFFCY